MQITLNFAASLQTVHRFFDGSFLNLLFEGPQLQHLGMTQCCCKTNSSKVKLIKQIAEICPSKLKVLKMIIFLETLPFLIENDILCPVRTRDCSPDWALL